MRRRRGRGLAIAWVALLLIALPQPALARGKPPPPDSQPRTVTFSDLTWLVKRADSPLGPGPNRFSDSASNVWVDGAGALHLKITRNRNQWLCAEVIAQGSFGYGTYTFGLASAPDLDPNVVLGMFTWNDLPDYAHREIDIEFARWSNASDPTNAQYVVQPYDQPDHEFRFTQAAGLTHTTHSFTWAPGQVTFESLDSNGDQIASYTYAGADVPVPGGENPRINLWLFRGRAPADRAEVEVVIDSFSFSP